MLAVDGAASQRTAPVGGKPAALAVENGWAGRILDGCVRDTLELAACAVGIRVLALCPVPTARRGAGQRDATVRLQGVWVRPGDWLCADGDGDGIVVLDRKPA